MICFVGCRVTWINPMPGNGKSFSFFPSLIEFVSLFGLYCTSIFVTCHKIYNANSFFFFLTDYFTAKTPVPSARTFTCTNTNTTTLPLPLITTNTRVVIVTFCYTLISLILLLADLMNKHWFALYWFEWKNLTSHTWSLQYLFAVSTHYFASHPFDDEIKCKIQTSFLNASRYA